MLTSGFADLARRHLAALLLGLVVVLVSMNVGQVWALTITPSSPIAGQPFTISGTVTTAGFLAIRSLPGCSGDVVFIQDISPPSYSVTVPGQPAGSYTVSASDDPSGCVDFTIQPAVTTTTTTTGPPIPEYPLGLSLLATLAVIGYGVIRRRTRN